VVKESCFSDPRRGFPSREQAPDKAEAAAFRAVAFDLDPAVTVQLFNAVSRRLLWIAACARTVSSPGRDQQRVSRGAGSSDRAGELHEQHIGSSRADMSGERRVTGVNKGT
jgi:hypothetical protein